MTNKEKSIIKELINFEKFVWDVYSVTNELNEHDKIPWDVVNFPEIDFFKLKQDIFNELKEIELLSDIFKDYKIKEIISISRVTYDCAVYYRDISRKFNNDEFQEFGYTLLAIYAVLKDITDRFTKETKIEKQNELPAEFLKAIEIMNNSIDINNKEQVVAKFKELDSKQQYPHPRYFVNEKAYLIFKELQETVREKYTLADYSFIYRQMWKDGYIYEGIKEKEFRDFLLKEYNIPKLTEPLKTLENCSTDLKFINYSKIINSK